MSTTTKRVGRAVDMTGHEFYGCVVLRRADEVDGTAAQWLCRCECSQEFIADGRVIRRGDRRSCGCKSRFKAKTGRPSGSYDSAAAAAKGKWFVVERDGLTTLVRDMLSPTEALVEFQTGSKAWLCSECGQFPPPGSKSTQTCAHIETASRTMPTATALQIASVACPNKQAPTSSKWGGATPGGVSNDRAEAVALAKSAIARAEQAKQFDDQHQRITSAVTVRIMTDEDRSKLKESRARKHRLVGAPDPD